MSKSERTRIFMRVYGNDAEAIKSGMRIGVRLQEVGLIRRCRYGVTGTVNMLTKVERKVQNLHA